MDPEDNEERLRCRMPCQQLSGQPILRESTSQYPLGHGSDTSGLGDTTRVSDIGLDDIDTAQLEVGSTVLSRHQSFSQLNSS